MDKQDNYVTEGPVSFTGGVNRKNHSNKPVLHHISDKHPKHVLEALDGLRQCKELCDVVLNVGSRVLYAHRVILASCSPYFKAMFTGELAESRQMEVPIRDIDEHAMELLITFAYTGSITIKESNVETLLPAACLLQFSEIEEICCEFLKRQLDPTNCLGIRAFADTHACRELLRFADMFTHHNFWEVAESEEFLLLPYGQLLDILSSEWRDEINVSSVELYEAVMSWIKHNVSERRHHLLSVLQHVRLPLLGSKFLVGVVGTDMLIKSDEACRDLVDEANNYLLLPEQRLLMHYLWCNYDAINSVERYDPRSGWTLVSPRNKRRRGVGVAVLDNLLYAVCGHDSSSYLNSVERYDPKTNQWSSEVAPTSTCRTSVGVAVLNG
jgi:kelch-like protein 20